MLAHVLDREGCTGGRERFAWCALALLEVPMRRRCMGATG
jgi:hypothetical protein